MIEISKREIKRTNAIVDVPVGKELLEELLMDWEIQLMEKVHLKLKIENGLR